MLERLARWWRGGGGERADPVKAASPFLGRSDLDPDDHQFRPLGGRAAKVEPLSPDKHDQHILDAYWLWVSNPMARRYTAIVRDFVLGSEGVSIKATDEAVQRVVDAHWNDARNGWLTKQFERVHDLGLFGELIMPVFVSKFGRVRVGVLWPGHVEEVETDPHNADRVVRIHLKESIGADSVLGKMAGTGLTRGYTDGGALPRVLDVIDVDDDPKSPTFGRLVGDVFYFKVNTTSAGTRGTSDLLPISEWLDQYDKILFDRAEKLGVVGSFIWDVMLEGANDAEISEWLARQPTEYKPGAIRAHNEKVTYAAVAPDLKAADAETDLRQIRRHVLTGMGIPEAWAADAGDTNRATLTGQGVPTFKMLAARQRYIRHALSFIIQFVVDQAIAVDRLAFDVDDEFVVELPPIETEDNAAQVSTLSTLAATLAVAEDRGWVRPETASRLFATQAARAGMEYDAEAEVDAMGLALEDLAPGDDDDVDVEEGDEPTIAEVEPTPEDVLRYDRDAQDIADHFKTSRGTVISWARHYGAPYRRIRSRYRFNLAEIAKWVENGCPPRADAEEAA